MERKNGNPGGLPRPKSTGAGGVTLERAIRLYRLISYLANGPQTRAALTRRLKLGVRGFYRDLEVLRALGISVSLLGRKYQVQEEPRAALEKLPFPDPGLTLGEARGLAKGRTRAHRKVRDLLKQVEA